MRQLQQLVEETMRHTSPLKMEIVRRGLLQADVAQAVGISESRLSRILNGRTTPRDYELKHLSQVLGLEQEARSV